MRSLIVEEIRKDLSKLIGSENVSDKFYSVSEYCMNHVAKNVFAMSKWEPFVVVRPKTVEQLRKTVTFAYENNVPLFIRGGGTGYSGGEVATSSGIVIETTGLDRIISVDTEGRYVKCEAGITVKKLNDALNSSYNMWWPHDPGSRDWATVGGSISTLGCGAFTTKYGYAQHMVVNMKVMLANGELVEIGNKVRNDVAVYSLLDLFSSSEGTLGIIVEATLKIFPMPRVRKTTIGVFKTFEEATKTCYEIADCGMYPESLMLEDSLRFALEGLAPHIDLEDPQIKKMELEKNQAVLIASYAGFDDFVDVCLRKTKDLITSNKGMVVDDALIIEAYWKSKTELPSWSKELGTVKVHSFVPAIPLNKAPAFNDTYNNLVKELNLSKAGARYYVVLPLMECTISPTVMFNDNNLLEVRAYEELTRRFSQEVINMGGTPASTTAVGMRLIDTIEKLYPESTLKLARKIKSSIDPKGTLAPNKKIRVY